MVIVSLIKRLVFGAALSAEQHDENAARIEEGFENCAEHDHTHDYTSFSGLSDALASKIPLAQKAVANGVATLDAGTKVPVAQISNVLSTEHVNNLVDDLAAKVDTTVLEGIAKIQRGQVTLVAGEAIVSDAAFVGTEDVYPTHKTVTGTPGWLRIEDRDVGTFTIKSDNVADTSTVTYLIVTPAP